MLNRIAFLSIAVLGAAALPHAAAAADYYDEGARPSEFSNRDDIASDRFAHRQGQRSGGGYGRYAPGPVAFDERDPDRHDDRRGWGYGPAEAVDPRPVGPVPRYGGPVYGPRFDRSSEADLAYGMPDRAMPAYRAVSAPVYGDAFDDRAGLPNLGCTVQQAQSITPAGWRKTVTHRTCYRR